MSDFVSFSTSDQRYFNVDHNVETTLIRRRNVDWENTYNTWMETVFGVPQGSLLRPLLFNIFIPDLFFNISDINIASYADDNTPYIVADNTDDHMKSLEEASAAFVQYCNDLIIISSKKQP